MNILFLQILAHLLFVNIALDVSLIKKKDT